MAEKAMQVKDSEGNVVNLGSGFEITSIAYNGETITKGQLIAYLYEVVRLKKEAENLLQRANERTKQKSALKVQMKRQNFVLPHMDPPTGLAALLPQRRKAYEKWLAEAPKRERELKQKELQEDARIAKLREQYDKMTDEGLAEISLMNKVGEEYKTLLGRHILPPDYRKDDIPNILMMYLFNGRAQTLTEAINLYHEEKRRMEMLSVAEQQRIEAREAQQQQLAATWNQMEMLREQSEIQQKTLEAAREARDAAKTVEFVAWMDWVTN